MSNELNVKNIDFPYDEIRRENGDYFSSAKEAQDAGYELSQIWSVIETDGNWTYAPAHHRINVVGFVATAEHHDGKTYYDEP